MTLRYTAIIPVKRWQDAKQRLDLTSQVRGDLARAFAEDVVAVVSATPQVGRIIVVSSEPGIGALVQWSGAHLVADPVEPRGDGLNASIRAGAAWAAREHPDDPVVVVPADLPCLTSTALDALLTAVGGRPHVVPDAGGDGTALLVASRPGSLEPAFGPGSAARHVALGHAEVLDAPPALRRDVDSMDDLATAVLLGVGPSTGEVLRQHPADLVV